jgi:tRNA modification GTPase
MSVVYALATPPAKSAICVFRVSGEGCLDALEGLFKKSPKEHGFFCVRDMYLNNEIIDSVGLISFKGPKSYTGEDSFEVYGHGGLGVMGLIMDAFQSFGFEEAGPGEFTKRAFLNNKLSLNESESVLDVINSTSKKEVFLASQSLSGKFTKEVFGISEAIDAIRIRVEGEIDFSDEGEVFLDDSLVLDLDLLIERLNVFIQGCYNKKELGTKKTVLFIGPPNSGKSSVFNRLLGFERALVSDVAGTTRDLIESEVFYNELSFSVIDSAGIRSTADKIESRGIGFTVDGINDADVVVAVFENTKVDLLLELKEKLRDKKVITVLNKIDLCDFEDAVFDSKVSAKTGQGFDRFKNLIKDAFGDSYKKDSVYLVRDRHIKLFSLCLESLNKAYEILHNNKEMEIAAEELKVSRSCLDDLVGRKTPDDVLGDIFSNFCIGK